MYCKLLILLIFLIFLIYLTSNLELDQYKENFSLTNILPTSIWNVSTSSGPLTLNNQSIIMNNNVLTITSTPFSATLNNAASIPTTAIITQLKSNPSNYTYSGTITCNGSFVQSSNTYIYQGVPYLSQYGYIFYIANQYITLPGLTWGTVSNQTLSPWYTVSNASSITIPTFTVTNMTGTIFYNLIQCAGQLQTYGSNSVTFNGIINLSGGSATVQSTISGPTTSSGITSGLNFSSPINVTTHGIYLPTVTPTIATLPTTSLSTSNTYTAPFISNCPAGNYVCGIAGYYSGGVYYYIPNCCSFNQ
jgi:hypothetical protein